MISVEKKEIIQLGHVGENEVTEIVFDIAPWITEFGIGDVVLTVKRACDTVPYPANIKVVENTAIWTITRKDVESYGVGKAELTYKVGEQVKKSAVYKTYTEDCLANVTPTPEDGQTWLDAMTMQVLKAEGQAVQSESHAKGGTGARVDEDTDNAKYYSEQANLDARSTDADRTVIEQAKTEVLDNAKQVGLDKQAVDQTAKDVADAEARIGNVEDNVKLMQTDVKANKDAVDLAKEAVDTSQADVARKAKQVATDKDTVVNAVNGFDQKVVDAKSDIDTTKTTAVNAVTAEGTAQKKVLDDTVVEFVADRQQINQNKDDIFKNAIKPQAQGNPIVLKDSADFKPVELEITGSTKQDGIPSPEYPQEIVNGVIDRVNCNGGNLLNINKPPLYENQKLNGENGQLLGDPSSDVFKINLFPNKKITFTGSKWITPGFCFYDKNDSLISCKKYNGKAEITDITPSNTAYILMTVEKENKQSYLVYGESISYEPYKGFTSSIPPIELSKWDKIKKIDGVWKKEKWTFKEVLKSLDVAVSSTATKYKEIWYRNKNICPSEVKKIGDIFCDKLKTISANEAYSNITGVSVDTVSSILIFVPNILTLEDAKKWIDTHKPSIQYKTKTPTYEVLPQETQEVLNNIQTFYPNSTIQTNEGIELNLTYIADTKNYVDGQIAEKVAELNKSIVNTQALVLER